MSDFKLSADVKGIESINISLGGLFNNVIEQVMQSVDSVAHSAFEQSYGNTPFIHATGSYHDAVQFMRLSKTSYEIRATKDYSSYLEWGQRSFTGYLIMERTADIIVKELQSNLQSIVDVYTKGI